MPGAAPDDRLPVRGHQPGSGDPPWQPRHAGPRGQCAMAGQDDATVRGARARGRGPRADGISDRHEQRAFRNCQGVGGLDDAGARASGCAARDDLSSYLENRYYGLNSVTVIRFFSILVFTFLACIWNTPPTPPPPPAGLGKGLHPDGDLVYLMTVSFHSIVSIYYI